MALNNMGASCRLIEKKNAIKNHGQDITRTVERVIFGPYTFFTTTKGESAVLYKVQTDWSQ